LEHKTNHRVAPKKPKLITKIDSNHSPAPERLRFLHTIAKRPVSEGGLTLIAKQKRITKYHL